MGSGVCIVIYGAISWAAREFKPVEVWVCLDICGPVFGICVFECICVCVCWGVWLDPGLYKYVRLGSSEGKRA